jgi:hypothetical protein
MKKLIISTFAVINFIALQGFAVPEVGSGFPHSGSNQHSSAPKPVKVEAVKEHEKPNAKKVEATKEHEDQNQGPAESRNVGGGKGGK